MSDEQRRRLEREARYDVKLAGLLRCLREDHVPVTVEGHSVNLLVAQPHPSAALNVAVAVRACSRCGLAYVEGLRGPQGGAVVVTADRPAAVRVPQPSPRPGYCTCGHRESVHSDLGWRGRCLYSSVGVETVPPCPCQRFVQEGTAPSG